MSSVSIYAYIFVLFILYFESHLYFISFLFLFTSYILLVFLNNNILTGAIPSEMGKNRFLHLIDLGFNQLSGTIPTELQNVDQLLSEILINENFLTGTI